MDTMYVVYFLQSPCSKIGLELSIIAHSIDFM